MFLKALIIGKRRFSSKTVLLSSCMSCINRSAAFALWLSTLKIGLVYRLPKNLHTALIRHYQKLHTNLRNGKVRQDEVISFDSIFEGLFIRAAQKLFFEEG